MIGFLLSNLWWLLAVALIAAIVCVPAGVWRLRWPLALAVCALFAGLFWLDANALRQVLAERDRADAVASLAAAGVARAIEHAGAETVSKIGETHEQDRIAAEAVPDAVAAAVHAGDLRLRQQWAACETSRLSAAAATAAGGDAPADGRAEAAGRIVRIGRDADDQLHACQATVAAYREMTMVGVAP
ncbi:hypothetical protein [Luteimonas fraxinea]|uniref:Uncharacterized protein n=1 Tax=Luteimonas fraxinea TaxID=2901869 RepID=A0ABS8UC28_9GAMM|nr:hypothetical protein [Luteimonas fraxinea]MCD9097048.1 hypothetical protein [Luteimonas fraxinea]